MRRVLVTGAAGFIGSHTARTLHELGHTVLGIDNFNDYYDPSFKQENSQGLTIQNIDITDPALEHVFATFKPEVIIHLAARAGVRPSILAPQDYVNTNVAGTTHLLSLAVKHNIKNFVFGSSSSVYGERTGPFSEEDRVDNPISPYAATKKAGEEMCATFHHLYDLNCVCLRFFTVYGERGRPDMAIYKFTENILKEKPITMFGDGTSSRDYTYVGDIVQGIIASMDQEGYEIINLGGSNPIELRALISLIGELCCKEPQIKQEPMQQGDVSTTFADISKAKRLLEYTPNVAIKEGLQRFVTWFKQIRQG